MRRVRFIIAGMHCPGCARKIAFFLEQAGAQEVVVDREEGTAEFSFAPPEDLDRYVQVVEMAGHYRVTEVVEVA